MSGVMPPSRVLKDLSVAALLGSDHSANAGETPTTLLRQAAAAGMRARAGRCCRATVEALEICPADTRSVATALQSATLERLLASPDAALIEEWCTLARSRGVRVPAVEVPVLLDWWARQPSRSPEVFEATGACGAWLAGLNPGWRRPVGASAVPADADQVWQTASTAERTALLATVRKIEPARAMAMVRATWDVDGAEERRKFIEVLGHGASAAEEPFFESALDDRSKTVRREAAQALTRLAGSALRGRMRERAASMVSVEKTKAGVFGNAKVKIKIEPPKTFDKGWERDGIEEQSAAGKGKRAFWLVQVLSAMDVAAWTGLTGLAPAELLATLGSDAYFDEAFKAMLASVAACPEQADVEAWSDAMIAACRDRKYSEEWRLSSVWKARPLERSEAMRIAFVSGNKAMKGADVWWVVASDPRAWSPGFSKRAVEILREATPRKNDPVGLWSLIESVSMLVHPGAADVFERLVGEIDPNGRSESIRKSLDRVRLRAEMHKEFRS
jgi:hypothetical protein